MIRQFGLGVLWLALGILASAPLWLSPAEPQTLAITEALRLDGDDWQPVKLPQARRPAYQAEHYRVTLPLQETAPLYLFIPTISHQVVVELAGHELADTRHRTTMIGLASGTPALIPLPAWLLQPGDNIIDIHLQSMSLVPGYLSTLYVGTAEELAPHYRSRVFLLEYLRLMVPAGQLLMTLVVLVLWLYRPQEALFGWLTLLLLTSMFIYLGMLQNLLPFLSQLMPYLHILGSAASIILVITVLLVAGVPPPRWLKLAAGGVPALCLLLALLDLVAASKLVMFVNAPVNMIGLLVSLSIATWAAVTKPLGEAWLLLFPLLLALVTALHDYGIVAGQLDGPVLLSVYYRPAMMIGIAMILMRRLGISLNQLDNINAYLTLRLQEQEQELARLHAEERKEAARRTLSEERQRLTADLHDGLSGHLASIIALSEREQSTQVERAAREALDDLRLVIHSLDIQDHEFPVALAGLRERLERQLKRMGISLQWSMVRLPDVTGVTPSHVLNVLRILQEAVTNAIKHGKATAISVVGSQSDDGAACITVENDGIPFPRQPNRTGTGLANMRRRIRQLNGSIEIEGLEKGLETGTRLTLKLPLQLPETANTSG